MLFRSSALRLGSGRRNTPVPPARASGSCTGTSARWTRPCGRATTHRTWRNRSQRQRKKQSSDCWHENTEADGFRRPPLCLTIHPVQKRYLWESSVGRDSFSLSLIFWGKRFVMLRTLIPSVKRLCSRADVAGAKIPIAPSAIRLPLKPMTNR